MRKNASVMALLLAALLLLTACQPTPEAEPVIQKDTEKLIEIATTTVTPEGDSSQGEESTPAPTAEPVPFEERFGERFTVDYTTTTSGTKVVGDVKIQYLSDYAFPMYRMKNVLPEGEKVRELARRLLGSEEVYEKTLFQSKADIKSEIDSISSIISNKNTKKQRMEDFGETEEEYEQWLKERQEKLRELQEKYNSMTGEEQRPLFESWDGTYSTEPLEKDELSHHFWLVGAEDAFGKTPTVNVFYRADETPYFDLDFYQSSEDWGYGYHISEVAEDWSVPCKGAKMTPQEAVDMAMALLDGIMEVVPVEVRWGDNGDDTSRGSGYAYTVLLTPVYEGAGAVYTGMTNYSMQEIGEGSYTPLWRHESVKVAVNEEGIRSCSWSNHMEVQEKLTESVNLLDFETIYNLFIQQMNRYLATEDADMTVELTGVSLGLMRIREEDSPYTALLVPVWYFRGLEGKTDYYQEVLGGDHWPLCVLNAIDGSVINTNWGY